MPITSQIKGYPFELKIEIDGKPGVILCDQICCLDWRSKKAQLISHLPVMIYQEAMEKFKVLIK